MKPTISLTTFLVVLTFLLSIHYTFSQGNSNGNANSNNNANGNALKWETQGNNADTSHFIGTTNPIALKMRTNNVERLRITKDGKFGIGISNPLEKFELQGNLKLTGDIIFSDYADVNDTTDKVLFVDKNGKTQTKSLKDLSDFLYVPYNCDELLDINGNVVEPTWSNGLNKIYNACPINVGIGTPSPQFTLDARGQIRVTRNIFLGSLANYDFNDVARLHIVNVQNLEPDNKGDFIRLETYSTSEDGNLETVFKVDQNGYVTARDVKVTLDPIPDYVFLPDYDLPTIEEQATFIRNNGHLLRMPSESEILQTKLGLGKIVMNNLRISEEQMLYIIEVNEEVEELEEENEDLQKRVEELERLVKKMLEQQ
tara:strand:- start:69990 stop:71099 length:1110 start_codon:yes stop_codon:yes gene_type:complete